jgi:tetratricopeptide (TPR) repeat protein
MTSGPSVRISTVTLALAALLVAAGAAAEPVGAKAEAKQHFDAGNALVANEDYAAAAAEFELSVQLYSTKSGLFNLANCYKALNRYGDSLGTLARLEREFAGKLDYLEAEVATMKSTIEGMVGRLEVLVDRDGAEILVDGAHAGVSPLEQPLVLAPGDRIIEARYPGFLDSSQTVRIVAREQRAVSFTLEESPALPPGPAITPPEPPAAASGSEVPREPPPALRPNRGLRAGAWACFIVGAGAALASLGAYGFASERAEDFESARDDYTALADGLETAGPSAKAAVDGPRAWDEMVSSREDAELSQKFGLGFAIGAGVLVAASVALFVAGRERDEGAAADVTIGAAPGGFVVEF